MTERKLKIINKMGIHARPASMIVQTAMQFSSSVYIKKEDFTVDAKSIMGIMMLAAGHGTELILQADGDDEKEALDKLEDIFNKGFGEEI